MKLILYILLIISTLISCSDISKEALKKGTDFAAQIIVSDDPDTEVLDKVVVKLFDKEGDAIATERIKISINNQVLKLFMKQGNYYDVTHWYIAEDIPFERFHIDIVMEDSTNYELASFTAFERIDTKNAVIVKNEINGGYKIQWESLGDFDEMQIARGFEVHKENVTTTMDSTMRQTINSKKGVMDIEKSFAIHDTLREISYLYGTFLAKKTGLLNTDLLENSTIEITSEFSINAEEIIKH